MPNPGNLTVPNIAGGSQKEGREGTIDFFQFNQEVRLAIDPRSGSVTGRRQHSPVRVQIPLEKSFPLLCDALARNKAFDGVKFDFYRINPESRAEEKYATITLNGARIEDVKVFKPDTQVQTNERRVDTVEVSFIYDEITWEYLPESIVATDRWRAPGESEGEGG